MSHYIAVDDPRTGRAVLDVVSERARQEQLKREGRFYATLDEPCLSPSDKFTILMREVGEVAQATAVWADCRDKLIEARQGLRAELVQVAALAVAWIEGIDTLGAAVAKSTHSHDTTEEINK